MFTAMRPFAALIAFFCLVLFTFCKNDGKTGILSNDPEVIKTIGGHWIAIDFAARVNQYGSVLQAMNYAHKPFAFTISIDPGNQDSVTCYNGFESWKLPFTLRNDTLEIKQARQNQSVYLVFFMNGQEKEITMFDQAPGGTQTDRLIKSKAQVRNGESAFRTAVNHNLFGGYLRTPGKPGAPAVRFLPNGVINDFKDYNFYKVCLTGDCYIAGQDIDIVELSRAREEGSAKFFGYRQSAQNDTLRFFEMIPPQNGEKGLYQVGKVAYTFLRSEK